MQWTCGVGIVQYTNESNLYIPQKYNVEQKGLSQVARITLQTSMNSRLAVYGKSELLLRRNFKNRHVIETISYCYSFIIYGSLNIVDFFLHHVHQAADDREGGS